MTQTEIEAKKEDAKDQGLCHRCGHGLDDGFACLGDCPSS